MVLDVEVQEQIEDIATKEWNAVVESANAPIFYKHEILKAYEHAPLQPINRFFYLVARDRDSHQACAVLPAYLVEWSDPLGVLSGVLPHEGAQRLLLTHVWHCYDSRLPATTLTQEIVAVIHSRLSEVAYQAGAEWFGFVNVDTSTGLLPLLAEKGLLMAQIETRYRLDLTPFHTMDDYFNSLKKSRRHKLRRDYRRALEAGVQVSVEASPFNNLREVVELCQLAASKHGNTSYYPARALEEFLYNAGPSMRIISVHFKDRRIAASICFLDNARFHTWAGGADYGAGAGFSPNYVLFHEEVRVAITSGCSILEGGRRNEQFKLKYGMRPIPLYACFSQTAERTHMQVRGAAVA